jgi:hypothetical protein
MSIELLPEFIRENYECHEWRHACAIMHTDFPEEWGQMIDVLMRFRLFRNYITIPGGRKSHVSKWIDAQLLTHGWIEKKFDTKILVDAIEIPSPTHSVDCFKNRIALEIEWNNKDPFYDRDLNNFRLLHQLDTVSAGVIVTRCSHLQEIFVKHERGDSYGNSTTHMGKLLPKIKGGGGGGCPILVLGISNKLYVDEDTVLPVMPKKPKKKGSDESVVEEDDDEC